MSEIAELQAHFAECLLLADADPVELFQGDVELAAKRFALYRGNLTANWERSLGNACPVLQQLVGKEFFRALAREYGRAKPPREGDLNRFGAQFAEFLDDFTPIADYPYLPDMARLEWALHCAHYAPDARALDSTELARMGIADLDRLHLKPRAPFILLQSRWAIADLWQAHQADGPGWPDQLERTSCCIVCRPRWRAQLLCLSVGEFQALRMLDQGMTLGAALEAADAAESEFDAAAALPRWLQAGLFAAAG